MIISSTCEALLRFGKECSKVKTDHYELCHLIETFLEQKYPKLND